MPSVLESLASHGHAQGLALSSQSFSARLRRKGKGEGSSVCPSLREQRERPRVPALDRPPQEVWTGRPRKECTPVPGGVVKHPFGNTFLGNCHACLLLGWAMQRAVLSDRVLGNGLCQGPGRRGFASVRQLVAQPLRAVGRGLAWPTAKGWSPAPHTRHGREGAAPQSLGDLVKIQVKATRGREGRSDWRP